jgi:hypothetical protein
LGQQRGAGPTEGQNGLRITTLQAKSLQNGAFQMPHSVFVTIEMRIPVAAGRDAFIQITRD